MAYGQESPRSHGAAAVIVRQGRILDYIDGITQRKETPEEYVRQEIAKSLVREYGYEKDEVAVELTMRMGSRRPRADLVVFEEGDPHTQDRARVIVECKSEKTKATARKDGVGQLQSHLSACPNAQYGMWTNGVERFCYKRVDGAGVIGFEEIPDIPGKGRSEDEIERPRFDQLKAASSDALLFAFRRCHNYIAGNQGLQKPEAFWELLKVIFCKIHDERLSREVEFYATTKERDGLNGRLKAKKRLESLFAELKTEYPTIFRPNEDIELNPEVLAYIVSQLQMYSLLESDVDVKGRAYEEIVGSNLRGDRGEFFTPRNICQMAVAMLDPCEGDLILDPACGTSGFLITAMNHVIEKIRTAEIERWGDIERAETGVRDRVQRFAQNYIAGMDLNPNLVKASKMNMVMNNDGTGGLFQANSLKAPITWDEDLRARSLLGRVDLLFTNPPFGSKIPIDDPSILEAYDLGHVWRYDEGTVSLGMAVRVSARTVSHRLDAGLPLRARSQAPRSRTPEPDPGSRDRRTTASRVRDEGAEHLRQSKPRGTIHWPSGSTALYGLPCARFAPENSRRFNGPVVRLGVRPSAIGRVVPRRARTVAAGTDPDPRSATRTAPASCHADLVDDAI